MCRLLLLVLLLAFAPTGPAVAATAPNRCGEDSPIDPDNTDGDDAPDYAIGQPGAGTVTVYQSTAGPKAVMAPGGEAGFGASVAIGDVDGDGCGDLVVGAPGANAVVVFPGTKDAGVGAAPPVVLHGADGDDFGAAVAISAGGGYDVRASLWVGAPGRSHGRGAVDHFRADGTGTLVRTTSFASFKPAAHQAFGALLAPDNGHGAYVGVPRRTVAGQRDAGVLQFLSTTQSGKPRPVKVLALAHPRRNDRFGASVGDAVGGAPGRTVDGHRGAGSIAYDTGKHLVEVTQDSKGVPGDAATNGHFGSAVAGVFGFLCSEDNSIAVSVKGGVVVVPGAEHCAPGEQLKGLPSGSGTALGVQHDTLANEDDAADRLLVSTPTGYLRDGGGSVIKAYPLAGPLVFGIPEE